MSSVFAHAEGLPFFVMSRIVFHSSGGDECLDVHLCKLLVGAVLSSRLSFSYLLVLLLFGSLVSPSLPLVPM